MIVALTDNTVAVDVGGSHISAATGRLSPKEGITLQNVCSTAFPRTGTYDTVVHAITDTIQLATQKLPHGGHSRPDQPSRRICS
jgi:hypothetical protein